MDVDRQSFIIYKNFYEPIKHLNNTDLGKLFRAIFEYNLAEKNVNGYVVPPEVKIPFEFFRNQFNLDEAKWMKRVNASRENGMKGGRPPQPREPTGLPDNQDEPPRSHAPQAVPARYQASTPYFAREAVPVDAAHPSRAPPRSDRLI